MTRTAYLIGVAWVVAAGCAEQPCDVGANMTNARLVAGVETDATGPLVRIAWEPGTELGAELPQDYFEQVRIERGSRFATASAIAVDAALTNEREITVHLDPAVVAMSGAQEFLLAFPDRRDFVDCGHPGQPDVYLLRVSLVIDDTGALESATLRSEVALGPI